MGYLWMMAWRNLFRNQRRSLLAVISVTLSILLISFMQGLVGGVMDSMVRNYTRNETGHIRIATPEFEQRVRFMPVDHLLQTPQTIRTLIQQDPLLSAQVETMAERITFGTLLTHEGQQKAAMGLAGDPAVEKELLMLARAIQPGGRYLAGERELVMGQKLADALHFKVGETVPVMARGSDDALHLRKFKLVGVFQTGLGALDERIFQLGLADARALLRAGEGTQQLILMLKDHRQADVLAAHLKDRMQVDPVLQTLSVLPWTQVGETYQLTQMASKLYGWIYAIIALLGAIIIANIMMMVVLERRREIGILRALGFSGREVLMLFTIEGAVLGLVGSLTGATLGFLINLYLSTHGIDFSKATAANTVPIDSRIFATVSGADWGMAVLIGTSVATVIALLPSRRAAKMGIVEAIKSV